MKVCPLCVNFVGICEGIFPTLICTLIVVLEQLINKNRSGIRSM
jgi:sorbitol-specific phosphotransferase system component IIC